MINWRNQGAEKMRFMTRFVPPVTSHTPSLGQMSFPYSNHHQLSWTSWSEVPPCSVPRLCTWRWRGFWSLQRDHTWGDHGDHDDHFDDDDYHEECEYDDADDQKRKDCIPGGRVEGSVTILGGKHYENCFATFTFFLLNIMRTSLQLSLFSLN